MGTWKHVTTFLHIRAMLLRLCHRWKRRKETNGAKDYTGVKYEEGTRDINNIAVCLEGYFVVN